MRKIVKFSALALLILSVLLVGCSPSDDGEEKKEIAMIIPIPAGDPFIEIAYSGVEQLGEEEGYNTRLIEALDKSEYSEQIRAMAEEGANPIYVMWDDLAEEAFPIAEDFPDTKFIIVDTYATTNLPNVKTIVVEPQQAAFIAGFVASKTTETDRVAWIGSMKMPVIDRFRAGFEAGAKYGNPDIEIESLYLGTADDPNKGSEMALQVISKGADIVMHSANMAGLGVIQAAAESGVLAIGVDEWQGGVAEGTVFWSALKDIAGAVYESGKSAISGNFESGITNYDINSGVALYDERDYNQLSAELKAEVDALVVELQAGTIEVPTEVD